MSKLPSLIEISNDLHEFNLMLEARGGEISDQECAEIALLNLQSEDKVYNYCLMFDRIEAEIALAKEQKKNLDSYIASLDRSQAWLEKIAGIVIDQRGTKLIGKLGRWINKRKSTSLEIVNEALIPPIYYKIETKLDKAAVKEAILKRGEYIEGCVIKENTSLQWK